MTNAPTEGPARDGVEPTDADLFSLGYAPGDYLVHCLDCKEVRTEGYDKRAIRCRPCAIAAWNRRAAAPRPLADEGVSDPDVMAHVDWLLIAAKREDSEAEHARWEVDEFSHRRTATQYREAAALIRRLAGERDEAMAHVAEFSARNVELSILAHRWMVAHDSLKGGEPYTLPIPADMPNAFARIAELEARATRAEAERDGLRGALKGIDDDYMTSEAHHPGYVLIPSAKFDQLRRAARALAGKAGG